MKIAKICLKQRLFHGNAMLPKGAYFAQGERLSLPLRPVLNEKPFFGYTVMPAGKQASSAMDGKLRAILALWISAFLIVPQKICRNNDY
ncbi:MAG: hypothetical protein PHH11_13385 [Methylomonas sp.]|nr:hypothetical protein [Methylomonas sp.]